MWRVHTKQKQCACYSKVQSTENGFLILYSTCMYGSLSGFEFPCVCAYIFIFLFYFKDWTYPMRREMQLPILQKHGITHVICIRQNIEANFIKPNFQQLFRYLVLDIADNPVENIIRFFPMTKEFIDGSLQSGGKVLVHGNAGISRSAALVIAYIMETFGVKYRDAFTYVQERRFCINPNAGFVHQLQEYEAIYLAKLTIQMMSPLQLERSLSVPPGTTGSLKRMHEEDEELGNMQVAAAQNG
nr:PREDICTED: serine/threonine/tyrosine-interacting protein isoform X2 [Struthio camelus australis]